MSEDLKIWGGPGVSCNVGGRVVREGTSTCSAKYFELAHNSLRAIFDMHIPTFIA